MRKTHPDAAAEARWCEQLGPSVCPQIWQSGPDWYVMELLSPAAPGPGMLLRIEKALQKHVWRRVGSQSPEWIELLQTSLGVSVPEQIQNLGRDLWQIHGDPTIANLMERWDDGTPVLIDPKPSGGRIPWFKAVDHGKILQSMCGWEIMLGMDVPWQNPPWFTGVAPAMQDGLWWLHVHALRIKQRELSQEARPEIIEWATRVAEGAHHAAGL